MPIAPVSLHDYDRDFLAFSRGLGGAFERYGFAVIADHGVAPMLIDRALAETRAVFALPDAAKRACVVPGGAGQRGYTPFGREAAKGADVHDLKEFWHVGREQAPGADTPLAGNVWPTEVPGFREAALQLYDALEALGARVLRAIARHLGASAPGLAAPPPAGASHRRRRP